MQALILAAGRGSRLARLSQGKPKCLIEIAGQTLIARQLATLRRLGITDIGVVVGYESDAVRRAVGPSVTIIDNPDWATTNSIYSMWIARAWIRGPFMLLNCDLLAHPDVYQRVARGTGSVLAYDSESGDDAEHMKVVFDDDLLSDIRKDLSPDAAQGESLGVLKFDRRGAAELMRAADDLVRDGHTGDWAPAAVRKCLTRVPIVGIDVADLPWTEIDFPHDIRRASRVVWPAIRSLTEVHHVRISHRTRPVHRLRPRSLHLLPESV